MADLTGVAVSEKKMIWHMDPRHTNTLACILIDTAAAVLFMTRTGRNISAIPTGIDGAMARDDYGAYSAGL